MLLKSIINIITILLLIRNENVYKIKAYKLNDPPPICSAYEMLILNTKQCVSRCPIRCSREVCYEDGACPCENSYMTSFADGGVDLVCGRTCLPGCIEAGGYCAASQICLCSGKRSYFNPIARKCKKHSIFKDKCGGRCIYGKCDYRGNCICAEGFRINNNLFGQLCSPVCKQDCGRGGYCFLPNMCAAFCRICVRVVNIIITISLMVCATKMMITYFRSIRLSI